MPREADLDAIRSPEPPPSPDPDAELESDRFDARRQTLVLQDLEQDIGLRKQFAWYIFYLIVAWLAAAFLVLAFQGFAISICGHFFKLSDSVLLALIGGTTVNVLGIFVIVVRYLFPQGSARVS
jgi:hypothetical protein